MRNFTRPEAIFWTYESSVRRIQKWRKMFCISYFAVYRLNFQRSVLQDGRGKKRHRKENSAVLL